MKHSVDYFFTPQSPWAYLGHAEFMKLLKRHAAAVNIKPVNLGRVFATSGGLPLAQRAPQRQAYRLTELDRFRRALNVPLNLNPRHFPVVSDAAACILLAIEEVHGADHAMQMQMSLGSAVWADEKDIADPATLIALASGLGLDGAALVKHSETAAVAARYEELTEEAIARGVFGAPTYILDGEPFWGQDRLAFLEQALAQKSTAA